MISFSPISRKRIHEFVILLYIAVLLGSVMHIHGHDYDPLARPEYKNTPVEESTHHSSTSYSACYIVGFAGSQSLEFKGFSSDAVTEQVFIAPFEILGATRASLLGAQPLRGPPTV